MHYTPYRPDWFYSTVHVPNLVRLQQEFTQLFWQVLGNNIPDTTGFFILDQQNLSLPDSLAELKSHYQLDNRWCSVNFSVINKGAKFGGIHYDFVLGAEKYLALNVPLLNCAGSYNVWYSGQPGEKTKIRTHTNNTEVIVYSDDADQQGTVTDHTYWVTGQVQELARVECTEPMLVHVGRPHQPEVDHEHLRVMLSLRFRPELSDEEFDRLIQSSS